MQHQKSNKICSISNFSTHSQTYLSEISLDVHQLIAESKKDLSSIYTQPVFIISQDFQAKHINALTQLLEDYGIHVQFQSTTDSLGVELNKNFFVVVDNKLSTQKLGSEFNSSNFTIVNYPKTGSNKKSIYCQQPQEVFQRYKNFTNKKSQIQITKIDSNLQQKANKVNQCITKNGSNAFNMLSSQGKGIKLKSISKYDRIARQLSTKKMQCFKVKQSKNLQNKQKLVFSKSVMKEKNNLYFVQNSNNLFYINLIEKLYGSVKTYSSQSLEKSIFYCHNQDQVISQLSKCLDNDSYKQSKRSDIKGSDSYEKRNHYIVVNSQMALKICARIQSQLYSFKDHIKLVTVILTKQNNFDDAKLQKQMLVVKKSIQSSLFHSVVCNAGQCQKVLRSLGFINNWENCSEQSKNGNQLQVNEMKNTQKQLKSQFKQVSFKQVNMAQSNVSEQSYQPRSKDKIIKVIKKPTAKFNNQNQQIQSKTISQVNSGYCANKNKAVVQKMQNKIVSSSKRSLSSQKNIKSLEKSHVIKKKLKQTLKIQNQEPFVVQCSQLCFSEDQYYEGTMIRKQNYKKQKSCVPFSAHQQYFATSQSNKICKKEKITQQNVKISNYSTMDGLLYIKYNTMIQSIVFQLKQNCSDKVINKSNIKPFYFAMEYSEQLKQIWRNGKIRKFLSLLIDIQGMIQITKYYSDAIYQEDEAIFSSVVKSNKKKSQDEYMQNTVNFKMDPNHNQNIPELLLIFTLVSQKQSDNQVFNQFEQLSNKLPRCEIIKCVVPQNMSDNQMRSKSKSIYNKMMEFFIDLEDHHENRFIQTA